MSAIDRRPGWICAWLSTLVGAVFSLVFAALLVQGTIIQSRDIAVQEQQLTELRNALNLDHGNDGLVQQIRSLDSEIRTALFARMDWGKRTVWCLLGAVIVLLAGAKGLHVTRPRMPNPQPEGDTQAQWLRHMRWTRLGLGTGIVLLIGLSLWGVMTAWVYVPEVVPQVIVTADDFRANWARFRGLEGAAHASDDIYPTHWDGTEMTNIRWKTPIPLMGQNSPIVWGNRVFCSGAKTGLLQVYCFDADQGTLLWTGDVPCNPKFNDKSLYSPEMVAASTMACDGLRVYAVFASGDITGFDFEGQRLWHVALGVPDSTYGYASSLETYQQRVIIQFDQGDVQDNQSRLIALDGATGRVAWETPRPVANVWTSPVVARVCGRDQLLTVSDPWTQAYDPATGQELWRAKCARGDLASTPIVTHDKVLACEPYAQMAAIRCDGTGDVTDTHIAWIAEEGAPEITSPVSNDQWACLLDGGELTFIDVNDGSLLFRHDVDGMFQASPSWVNDRLYLLSEDGTMTIAEVGEELKIVAQNPIEDTCYASPAFVRGRIFIRGEAFMWCVGE